VPGADLDYRRQLDIRIVATSGAHNVCSPTPCFALSIKSRHRWSRRNSTRPAPFQVELIVLHSDRSQRDTIGSPNGRLRIFSIPPHIAATSMQDFRVSRHVAKQFHPARLSWSQLFMVKRSGNLAALIVPLSCGGSHNRPRTAALLPRFCQTMMASSVNN
jgi:hypothetical protein